MITVSGCQDQESELSGWEDLTCPFFEILSKLRIFSGLAITEVLTPNCKSYLGEMAPHLLILPLSSTTIFLDLWSSTTSNSPM